MNPHDLVLRIQDSAFSTALRESQYAFPLIEAAHLLGLALSFGLGLLTDLRLTGLLLRRLPLPDLLQQLRFYIFGGFALTFLTGGLLFWAEAETLYSNLPFWLNPSADALWEAVSSETGPNGVEEYQPRTEQEWLAVRRHTLLLIEAGNLLLVENRDVSHGSGALEDAHVPGILDARQVRAAIDADRGAFSSHALALHTAGTEALAAVDARNPQRLLVAGEKIDHACEGCHSRYWYPNAEQPTWPAPPRKP
jgi:hypothetical protein